MPRRFKDRTKKIGLPPGSLVYVGEAKDKVRIRVVNYDKENLQDKILEDFEDCSSLKEQPGVKWIDIVGIHNVELMDKIGKCFDLHPLVLEDILATDQRPKIEEFENYLFIVFKIFHLKKGEHDLEPEQVSLLLFTNTVISFREKESELFLPLERRLGNQKDILRSSGADYLLYTLLDIAIDNHFLIVDRLGEALEPLEEKAITYPLPSTIQSIHHLRRKVMMLRENLWAMREIISHLERGTISLVNHSLKLYFRDLLDHIFNLMETTETIREMLASILDIYLSSVSNRLNQIMKVLTIIATLFMPLTFIVGVYGMNFKFMPELEWRWAYPAVWGFMITVSVMMYLYFKRKGWL